MKRLLWTGLLLIVPWTAAQSHDEKRTRSSDGTRDAVELRGNKSQKYLERVLTHNREVQDAADLLRQKGYKPLEVYVIYTERTGRGTPNDHMEGEAVWWAWEDYDANLATGIVYGRHAESGNAEVTAVQFDASTAEERWHWTARRSGKGKRAEIFRCTADCTRQILPARFRQDHLKLLQPVQRTECYSWECAADYHSYYACTVWGCTSAAFVGFLLGPVAGPPAFFGGCTGAMIGCLRELF